MDYRAYLGDFRDELAYIASVKMSASRLTYRDIASRVGGLTPSLLSRVRNYNLDSISTERLILLIGQLDVALEGRASGFAVSVRDDGEARSSSLD